MALEFILSDLAGVQRSELPGSYDRRVAIPVKSIGTAGFTIPNDHPQADFLLECDGLLRVYDVDYALPVDDPLARILLHHGTLVSAEETADANSGSIAVTSADPYWTLIRRLIGKSTTGYTKGTPTAKVPFGTIITDVLALANAEDPSGLRLGTVLDTAASTYVEGWFYKAAAEALQEMLAAADAPEWRVRPTEYDAGYYGAFDVAPFLSTPRPTAAFEHGGGKHNVQAFRRVVTKEGTANRIFGLPPNFPDAAEGVIKTAEDPVSRGQRGLLEAVLSSSITVDQLRQALVDAHLAVRALPRQTITFDPVSSVGNRIPRVGREIDVGDTFPFATYRRSGELRTNVWMRLYQAEITEDRDKRNLSYRYTLTPGT